MTSDLAGRVWQHKTKAVAGFTTRYGVDRLVWFEIHETAESRDPARKANKGVEAGMED